MMLFFAGLYHVLSVHLLHALNRVLLLLGFRSIESSIGDLADPIAEYVRNGGALVLLPFGMNTSRAFPKEYDLFPRFSLLLLPAASFASPHMSSFASFQTVEILRFGCLARVIFINQWHFAFVFSSSVYSPLLRLVGVS